MKYIRAMARIDPDDGPPFFNLLAATELGYYEQPRQATHDDVARAMDCAPATASNHL